MFVSTVGPGKKGLFLTDTSGSFFTSLTASFPDNVDFPFINDSGKIVFQSTPPFGGTASNLILTDTTGSSFTTLIRGSALGAFGISMNDLGQIAFASVGSIFLTDINDAPPVLIYNSFPNKPAALSTYINNLGQIVFDSQIGAGMFDVFLTDLNGSPPVNITANFALPAVAPAINGAGQIVVTTGGPRNDIYLTDTMGQNFINLTADLLGGSNDVAINDRGQIVFGNGVDVFLGTPIPEPTILTLLVIGLAGLVLACRRVKARRF